jgi:putative transposase
MPYTYRHLTPEEQAAIVAQRRARGYPLHAPPHPYREAGWYMITAANYEHAPIMQAPERRSEFEQLILAELQRMSVDVAGWVVLPNHYHLLVGVDTLDTISAILKQVHGLTSRVWNLADGTTGKRRVWYKFTDRRIRDERHFYCALNYIHFNPVKHGYAAEPYAWEWSSVLFYLETQGREWLRHIWKDNPVGNFCAGCDD